MCQENEKIALNYLERASDLLTSRKETEDRLWHIIISEKGRCQFKLGNIEEALILQRIDSTYFTRSDYHVRETLMHLYLGDIYVEKKDFQTSAFHLNKAENIIQKRKLSNYLSEMQVAKGELKYKLQEADSAVYYFKEAIKNTQKYDKNFAFTKEAHRWLSEIYYKSGADKLGQFHSQKALSYSDSLLKQVKPLEMSILIAEYEQEKQRAFLEKKQRSTEAKAERRKWLSLLLGISSILSFGLVYYFYQNYRQKQHFAKKLQKEVINKTQEISQVHQQLEKSHQELKLFYAAMAHDFRYPILHIQEQLDDLEKRLGLKKGKEIGKSKEALRNLYESFAKLMRFFQMDDEPLMIRPLSPNLLLKDITAELAKINLLCKLNIQVEALPNIKADVLLVRQVFLNLIINAVKFSKEHEQPLLKIKGHQTEKHIHLFFSDNGIGIAPNVKKNLFESFVSERKINQEGLGIGLFIVKRIMERHGGKIRISSIEEESGTTFELIFLK